MMYDLLSVSYNQYTIDMNSLIRLWKLDLKKIVYPSFREVLSFVGLSLVLGVLFMLYFMLTDYCSAKLIGKLILV